MLSNLWTQPQIDTDFHRFLNPYGHAVALAKVGNLILLPYLCLISVHLWLILLPLSTLTENGRPDSY